MWELRGVGVGAVERIVDEAEIEVQSTQRAECHRQSDGPLLLGGHSDPAERQSHHTQQSDDQDDQDRKGERRERKELMGAVSHEVEQPEHHDLGHRWHDDESHLPTEEHVRQSGREAQADLC